MQPLSSARASRSPVVAIYGYLVIIAYCVVMLPIRRHVCRLMGENKAAMAFTRTRLKKWTTVNHRNQASWAQHTPNDNLGTEFQAFLWLKVVIAYWSSPDCAVYILHVLVGTPHGWRTLSCVGADWSTFIIWAKNTFPVH